MQYKTTRSLFRGLYQYKIVVTCAVSSAFRLGDMNEALSKINSILDKNKDDIEYAKKLAIELSTQQDLDIRVESPWISIYTNENKLIKRITKLSPERVKYICEPASGTSLAEGTVIMPKMDYDYRITLGKTTQEHSAFVEWADGNKNLKLTKSCIRDLLRNRTWGGTHFYVTGDKNLLLTRMHLGEGIAKVERIVKS